jgi:hypothetical protein
MATQMRTPGNRENHWAAGTVVVNSVVLGWLLTDTGSLLLDQLLR